MKEELDEIAARQFYALIPVPDQANILLVNHQPDPFIVNRADQLNRLVGRRVIDNQDFQMRVGLGPRRFKTVQNPPGCVEGRNADGN